MLSKTSNTTRDPINEENVLEWSHRQICGYAAVYQCAPQTTKWSFLLKEFGTPSGVVQKVYKVYSNSPQTTSHWLLAINQTRNEKAPQNGTIPPVTDRTGHWSFV